MTAAISRIHLAFDLWTSGNNFAIMAVSGHFLNRKGIQQQRLLALARHQGDHSGDNLAATLVRVAEDWGITDRIGTLVSDNATNNDTCTTSFFSSINPCFTLQDTVDRRMRCYGHILNLVGRAFLRGEDDDVFEEETQRDSAAPGAQALASDLGGWRAHGPVGKLRNIVKFIRSSPQRSEAFQQLAKEADSEDNWLLHQESKAELRLTLSNDTRWNSTYLMIERALQKKSHLQSFLLQRQVSGDGQIPLEAHLTGDDWLVLVELKAVLEPLYRQTMLCQGWGEKGSQGYLWEVLSGLEYLLDKMEAWRIFFDTPSDEDIEQSQ
ncbi:transposase-like protein, partial [Colletotrichum plurivorum]